MGYGVNEVLVPSSGGAVGGSIGGAVAGSFIGSILGRMFGGYGYGNGAGGDVAAAGSVRQAIDTDSILEGINSVGKSIPEQTIALMGDTHANEISTLQGFNSLQKDICAEGRATAAQMTAMAAEAADCCCNTQKELIAMGKDNTIATITATSQLQKDAANYALDCERQLNGVSKDAFAMNCETNLNIERRSHDVEIRDLKGHNELLVKMSEMEGLITSTAEKQKIEALQREVAALRGDAQTNAILSCFGNLMTRLNIGINQLGTNDKFINPTVVWPPYNPTLNCGMAD